MPRLAAVALLLAAPMAVRAADPWTRGEIAVEATFAALVALDYSQTRYAFEHPPPMRTTVETNPLLRKHLDRPALVGACLGSIALHAVVSHYLPRQWRRAWLVGTVVGEGANVAINATIWGVGFSY